MAAKTVVFESKYAALTLVRQPKSQIPLPTGVGYQTVQKTLDYTFVPVPSPRATAESGFIGVLTLREGQDKRDDDNESWLRDGEEVGEMRDAVTALMAHKDFGQDFWIQGHEPGTLYPRPVEFRRDVTVATATLDDEKLEAMLAEERRTHGRVDLLQEAEDALGVVRQLQEAAAAEQEKAAKKPAAKQPAAA